MFKFISQTVSICLEGTMFQRRPKKAFSYMDAVRLWAYSEQAQSVGPPYVLTQDEFKIKNDLISKLHNGDNRLHETRQLDRRGRAKWQPEAYEQVYLPPHPLTPSPQVEIYYKTLGLHITRDPRTTFTSLSRSF